MKRSLLSPPCSGSLPSLGHSQCVSLQARIGVKSSRCIYMTTSRFLGANAPPSVLGTTRSTVRPKPYLAAPRSTRPGKRNGVISNVSGWERISEDNGDSSRPASQVIYPWDARYRAWSSLATAAAAATAFIVPLEVALGEGAHAYDFLNNALAAADAALVAIFGLDVLVQSRTAKFDVDSGFTDNAAAVQKQYLQSPGFYADLLGFLPLDYIAIAAMGGLAHSSPAALELIPLLKLLHLVRLYRVRNLITYLLFNLNVPLLWVTVIRNLLIVVMVAHWAACSFFWEARHVAFDPDTLLGVDAALMSRLGPVDQYVMSLYWVLTTLSMVESNSVPETMTATTSAAWRSSFFLLFNITLGSYILGTITLLVVKQDERTGKYRDQSANLRQFTATNRLPADLRDSLQEHLRLHFDTAEASDEQVLSVFPSAIRRRILRHLYMRYLRSCYLFEGAPQRLLDALLAAARVEIFMPSVDIVSAGDYINELFLLVGGTVEVVGGGLGMGSSGSGGSGSESASRDGAGSALRSGDELSGSGSAVGAPLSAEAALAAARLSSSNSRGGRMRRLVGAGELIGEAAFFTEVPQLEAIRSASVCRVLVITRAAYSSLERSFPNACRTVLSVLQRNAELAAEREFEGRLRPQDLDAAWAQFSGLRYDWASSELADGPMLQSIGLPSIDWDSSVDVTEWSPRQQQVMSNLLRIRACVQAYISRQEADRTAEFLYAAAQGNIVKLREMIRQGCPPGSADYDGRCALELACAKGHSECVKLLLAAGADPSQADSLGSCPLSEACTAGHDDLIDLLLEAGAKLAGDPIEDAARLCTCVFVGDLPLLRRLLHCGLAVDAGDYDKRTAIHIAAAEGNLQAVRLLVEEGGADVAVRDRWGFAPLDEAKRVNAGPVVRYLEAAKRGAATVGNIASRSAGAVTSAVSLRDWGVNKGKGSSPGKATKA